MIGMGCKVGYGTASPVTYTNIANVVDLQLPVRKAAQVDKTVHSVTSRMQRSEPGLDAVDGGFFEVLQDLSNAAHKVLRTLCNARTLCWFRYEVPVNDALTSFVGFDFCARISDYEIRTPKEGEQVTRYNLSFDDLSIYEDGAAGATQIT